MTSDAMSFSPDEVAWQLVTASWTTHVIRAMAELGLADQLANGPRTLDDLARATGSDAGALGRLLEALVAIGVCIRDQQSVYRLTPVGDRFVSDSPGSVHPFAMGVMAPHIERAWHELSEAVRTGQSVYPHVHGLNFWDYLTAHPDQGVYFDAAMSGNGERGEILLTLRDLSEFRTIVDIGGGHGRLLAAVLCGLPDARGILFDRPEVVVGAAAVLRDEGVNDRCEVVGGNFFENVPGGADGYVLSSILHDWPDQQAADILHVCHRAMSPGSRIWVIEHRQDTESVDSMTRLVDLLMLVLFGARERTVAQYRTLLEQTGFSEITELRGDAQLTIIEATRE